MRKSLPGGGIVCIAALAVVFAVCSREAKAAGEWEWTQGQGWVQGAGVSRPTAKEQLSYAYELEQKGEYMDAARQYFLLIQNFPEAQEAGVGLQRLARCLFQMENYYTSFQAVEQVLKSYPNTGRMSDLLAIELSIAKKMLVSQANTSLFDDNNASARQTNTKRALEIVDAVLDHDPYGPSAAEALLVKGEAHLYINEISDARASFEKVLDEFSKSDFVERARLGILRCDSLLGQARPQEVYEQIQVVRETEADRQQNSESEDRSEFDDVEESINQLAEVEAAKMMEQAAQYKRMGTHNAVKSAEFLYREVSRRYPHTPQAEEARELLGGIKVPPEQSRVAKAIKSININPFSWSRDPEPPWIVPQLSPEDTVMVDLGIGPIAGVPETDFPVDAAAGVRPALLDQSSVSIELAAQTNSNVGFSPIGSGPPAASTDGLGYSPLAAAPNPGYDQMQVQSSFSASSTVMPPAPGSIDLEPSQQVFPNPNPLPSIPDSDLVMPGSSSSDSGVFSPSPAAQTYTPPPPAGNYSAAAYDSYNSAYAPPASQQPMSLGPLNDSSLSDLVGPARRLDQQPPYPEPEPGPTAYMQPYSEPYAPTQPAPALNNYYDQYAPIPEPPLSGSSDYAQPAPAPYNTGVPAQGGGWVLDDNDFVR